MSKRLLCSLSLVGDVVFFCVSAVEDANYTRQIRAAADCCRRLADNFDRLFLLLLTKGLFVRPPVGVGFY
jgi:hypothetical protein